MRKGQFFSVMRLGHQTLIVLSSIPADSDHHSWAVSDRKYRTENQSEIWLDESQKTLDSLDGWRWVALKDFKWVGFERLFGSRRSHITQER